ncbi:hypothetical protein JCM8097_003305 [Rhodosporidiobolus ruineniae]
MSAPLPPPAAPGSPSQPPATKIPRRRLSTQLVSAPPSRLPSHSTPTSPSKPSPHSHARKGSLGRAHFADPPASFFSPSSSSSAGPSSLQDRRRSSVGGVETREVDRRAPSLSIYIPSAPSPAQPPSSVAAAAAKSTRRGAGPSRPSPSSSTASPSAAFAPHTRRSSARTPRTSHFGSTGSSHFGSSSSSSAPVRPSMAERTYSGSTATTTYTSFDLQHPRTPQEEREKRELAHSRGRGWRLWFGRADDERDLERGEGPAGERTALLGRLEAGGVGEAAEEVHSGWRYVAGETWCYAKHILPPLLVFVVLVLLIALLAYRQAIKRVVHHPPTTWIGFVAQ